MDNLREALVRLTSGSSASDDLHAARQGLLAFGLPSELIDDLLSDLPAGAQEALELVGLAPSSLGDLLRQGIQQEVQLADSVMAAVLGGDSADPDLPADMPAAVGELPPAIRAEAGDIDFAADMPGGVPELADAVRLEAGAVELAGQFEGGIDPLAPAVRSEAGEIELGLHADGAVPELASAVRAEAGEIELALHADGAVPELASALRSEAGTVDLAPSVMGKIMPSSLGAVPEVAATTASGGWFGLAIAMAAAFLAVMWQGSPAQVQALSPGQFASSSELKMELEFVEGASVTVMEVEGDDGEAVGVIWIDEELML